jgi:hypothetical protein
VFFAADYTVLVSSFTFSFISGLMFIFVHACFNALNDTVSYINTPSPPPSIALAAGLCR